MRAEDCNARAEGTLRVVSGEGQSFKWCEDEERTGERISEREDGTEDTMPVRECTARTEAGGRTEREERESPPRILEFFSRLLGSCRPDDCKAAAYERGAAAAFTERVGEAKLGSIGTSDRELMRAVVYMSESEKTNFLRKCGFKGQLSSACI